MEEDDWNDNPKESAASYGCYGASVAEQKRGYLDCSEPEPGWKEELRQWQEREKFGGFCGRPDGHER